MFGRSLTALVPVLLVATGALASQQGTGTAASGVPASHPIRAGGSGSLSLERRGGITLLRFDQARFRLALHAGTLDPGGSGWRYGPSIAGHERRVVVAGFNGGFRLSSGTGGFVSYGRRAVPLRGGLASIVTYADGVTDVGSWGREVPAAGARYVSVRQNLRLLVDHGRASPSASTCGAACWGATLGGGSAVARSAIGVDGSGRLVWAGGESLTPLQLAQGLVSGGVARAAELDINPQWVAGYLYRHGAHGAIRGVVPVVPGQHGIPGQLLTPYSRDFFTVLSRTG
jgi:hypothetical protein